MQDELRRNKVIKFKVAEDELDFIKRKAELSGAKNLSCYLRKMAITGVIIKYDDQQLHDMQRDINRIGNNVNQIAVRVNKTGSIYYDDLQEIKEKVNELWQSLQSIQSNLQLTKQ